MAALTPVPVKSTCVVPAKFAPVSATARENPCVPSEGAIPVMVGRTTVNPLNAEDVPFGVVTVTTRRSRDAFAAIEIEMGSVLSVPPGKIKAVTPVPLKATDVASVKAEPLTTA